MATADQVKTRNDHLPLLGSKDAPGAEDRDRGLYSAGPLDPDGWVEQKTVAERPQDEPNPNTTFAERGKAAKKATAKKVGGDRAENKAVTGAESKSKPKTSRR